MGSFHETYNDPTYLGIFHFQYYLQLIVMSSKSFFLYLNLCIRVYIYSFMIGSKGMLRITEIPVNSFREI